MLEQVRALPEMLIKPSLRLSILPRNTLQSVPLGYNFNNFDDTIAATKTPGGQMFVTDPDALTKLALWFSKIEPQSLRGEEARLIIERATKHYSS